MLLCVFVALGAYVILKVANSKFDIGMQSFTSEALNQPKALSEHLKVQKLGAKLIMRLNDLVRMVESEGMTVGEAAYRILVESGISEITPEWHAMKAPLDGWGQAYVVRFDLPEKNIVFYSIGENATDDRGLIDDLNLGDEYRAHKSRWFSSWLD